MHETNICPSVRSVVLSRSSVLAHPFTEFWVTRPTRIRAVCGYTPRWCGMLWRGYTAVRLTASLSYRELHVAFFVITPRAARLDIYSMCAQMRTVILIGHLCK